MYSYKWSWLTVVELSIKCETYSHVREMPNIYDKHFPRDPPSSSSSRARGPAGTGCVSRSAPSPPTPQSPASLCPQESASSVGTCLLWEYCYACLNRHSAWLPSPRLTMPYLLLFCLSDLSFCIAVFFFQLSTSLHSEIKNISECKYLLLRSIMSGLSFCNTVSFFNSLHRFILK